MGRYARETVVSAERSRAEIEATLRRYGADQFVSGWFLDLKPWLGDLWFRLRCSLRPR